MRDSCDDWIWGFVDVRGEVIVEGYILLLGRIMLPRPLTWHAAKKEEPAGTRADIKGAHKGCRAFISALETHRCLIFPSVVRSHWFRGKIALFYRSVSASMLRGRGIAST